MDQRIKDGLKAHFKTEEISQIEAFLGRGFCLNGQHVIATIFLSAKRQQKSIADVLKECEKEWERSWKYQHPNIKGDPDAAPQNKISLNNIYQALEILSPTEEMKRKIPKGACVAKTRNSVYRFGKANKKGERTVSRDDRPLDFERCIILYLVLGEGMELKCLNASHPMWFTSSVSEILPQSAE